MSNDRFEILWQDRVVGLFDRKASDVGYYAGIWSPRDSDVTTKFESLLRQLDQRNRPHSGIVVVYRKEGAARCHNGLIYDFGNRVLIDDPNEIFISRLTNDKLIGLLQSCFGIIDFSGRA